MNEALIARLTEIKKNAEQFQSEEATKMWAILPVLECVGWNPRAIGEVVPEYHVGGGKVDYCLKHSGREQCFVEAKNPGHDLQNCQDQLLKYVFQANADLAVLTNGVTWWLYLPHERGSWEEKRFFVVDLENQDPAKAADHLEQFLGKAPLLSGDAVKKAKELLKGRERERSIKEALPKAWVQLLTGPDESLCRVLAETAEKMCGYKPDVDELSAFLRQQLTTSHDAADPTRGQEGYSNVPPLSQYETEIVRNKRPVALTFQGRRTEIRNWRDLPARLAGMLYEKEPDKFRRLLAARWGRKVPRFAVSARGMRAPARVSSSDMYMETHGSAQALVEMCRRMLRELGHSSDELHVEAQ